MQKINMVMGLHICFGARMRATDAIKFLISKGAEINSTNNVGSPLVLAAHTGQIDIVNFLLQKST